MTKGDERYKFTRADWCVMIGGVLLGLAIAAAIVMTIRKG